MDRELIEQVKRVLTSMEMIVPKPESKAGWGVA